MKKLEDKIVLITGSTSSIGIACAKQAIKDGAFKVILSGPDDIKRKDFDISLTDISDFIKLDVRSESDWENIIKLFLYCFFSRFMEKLNFKRLINTHIPASKKNFSLSGYFIVISLVFLFCSCIVYSQNLQVVDSIHATSEFSLKTNQNKICCQKPSNYFYKTDSIFSFRSSKGYFPSLIYNFGVQATSPLHFKIKEWFITGAAIGVTVTLIIFDNDIDHWATTQKQEHNIVNKCSPFITQFGGNYGVYSVIAIGSLSAAFKNQKGVQTSLLATQAMITSGLWVHLIKQLSGRERPEAAYIYSKYEGGRWYGPFAQYDQDYALRKHSSSFDSFPSGHTATAFSIATVFASLYSDSKAIPVLSYTAATFVGISRLTEHKHWTSDVFVGALLGYVCGKQVVANFNKTHQNAFTSLLSKSKYKPELKFVQYGNQIGLSLRL